MSGYSFNQNRQEVAFAKLSDVNASFKDLCAVCDAIRYKNTEDAMRILDKVINMEMPIIFRRNNKYMGARHELGGKKGKWPRRCAAIVKKLLKTALASAKSKGMTSDLYVVHASANKTLIARRIAPKGALMFGIGMYGPGSTRYSDLEFSKIELGVASDRSKLSKRIKRATAANAKTMKKAKAASAPSKSLPAVEVKEKAATPAVEPSPKSAEPMAQQSKGGEVFPVNK
jgi:large subunit ribosomal protein L22